MACHTDRFAPSPTGLLHLGHAFSALLGHDAARAAGGRFLLRIEDLDQSRARPAFEQAIFDDLRWLGVRWDGAVMRQSARAPAYAAALARLEAQGLLYPCICTRAELAVNAPQEGAEPPPYPGTCRALTQEAARASGKPFLWRLALELAWRPGLFFQELDGDGRIAPGRIDVTLDALRRLGDPALTRKDGAAAYHLAVVVDDAAQGITHVTRGVDLLASTPLHVMLQALLGLPTPLYRHHRLIRDETGKRLAKRDDARAIATLRAAGATAEEVRKMIGL